MSATVKKVGDISKENLEKMDIIMVKGIGYVVINNAETEPQMIKVMGDAASLTIEAGMLDSDDAFDWRDFEDEKTEKPTEVEYSCLSDVEGYVGGICYLPSNLEVPMTITRTPLDKNNPQYKVVWMDKQGKDQYATFPEGILLIKE